MMGEVQRRRGMSGRKIEVDMVVVVVVVGKEGRKQSTATILPYPHQFIPNTHRGNLPKFYSARLAP